MATIQKKYLPIAGMLLLLVIIGYFLIKPGNRGLNKTVINELPPNAGLTGKNLHFVEDNPEKGTRWILDADGATSSQNKDRITLTRVRLKLEPLNGSAMEIEGARGDYDKSSNEISLTGGIKGQSSNGYSIVTDNIVFNQKEDVLKTDGSVKISGPFFSVFGKGFLFYPERQTFKIISNATTTIDLKEGL